MKEFLNDRKKIASLQNTSVLMGAKVTIPRLVCTKEFNLNHLEPSKMFGKQRIIPLAVKEPSGQPL